MSIIYKIQHYLCAFAEAFNLFPECSNPSQTHKLTDKEKLHMDCNKISNDFSAIFYSTINREIYEKRKNEEQKL